MTKNIPLLQMIRNKSKIMISEHFRKDKDMVESLQFSDFSIMCYMRSLFHWPFLLLYNFLFLSFIILYYSSFNKRSRQLV